MFGNKADKNSLGIPDVVKNDGAAFEVLRVWASPSNPQTFTLQVAWQDPAAWGLLLVDVARHVSIAYAQQGRDEGEVLARIKEMWDAEWNNPTDDPMTLTP